MAASEVSWKKLIILLARGVWLQYGEPHQRRLNNHGAFEGYEYRLRRPHFPPRSPGVTQEADTQ